MKTAKISGNPDLLQHIIEHHQKADRDWPKKLEEAREDLSVALQLRELRLNAGMSLRTLAKRVGTSHSNIARLEAADYAGHSLTSLRRVAAALGAKIEVRIVSRASGD